MVSVTAKATAVPIGWEAVESRSRPGQFSFVNVYTGEKIAWKPDAPASREHGNLPPPPDDNDEPVRPKAIARHITAETDTLPEGWEARVDPGSGRTFYVHLRDKTTSWVVRTSHEDTPFKCHELTSAAPVRIEFIHPLD